MTMLVVKLLPHMISVGFWWSLVGLAVLAIPANAGATPHDLGTLEYRVPAECPTSTDFSAQVAARTPGWLAPSAPFTVTVVIGRGAQGFIGRVTLARGEQRTVRELQAAGCNELVQALAFIVAVVIDPHASSAPLRAPKEQPRAPVLPVAAPPLLPRKARRWFIAGPEVALETPLTGHVLAAERLFLGVGRGERSLPLSSARLSFARASSHASSPQSGALAEFELETARLDGCLLRVASSGLAFEPCPFLEFGRLRAVGIHRAGRVTSNQLWGSLGLALRPSWTFFRRLVLGAGFGVQVPLGRYRFAFTGEPELSRTPDVAFEGSLSLGLRFP